MTTVYQTAGAAVILKVRNISFMGVVLLLMVLLLLVVVRTVSKMADAKNKLARQLSGKADAWYIATGTVRGRFTSLSYFFLPCGRPVEVIFSLVIHTSYTLWEHAVIMSLLVHGSLLFFSQRPKAIRGVTASPTPPWSVPLNICLTVHVLSA